MARWWSVYHFYVAWLQDARRCRPHRFSAVLSYKGMPIMFYPPTFFSGPSKEADAPWLLVLYPGQVSLSLADKGKICDRHRRNCSGRTTAVQSRDPLVSRRRRLPLQESYDSLSLSLFDFEVFMTAVFSPSGFSDHPWHDTGDRQRKTSNEATFNVSPPT